MARRKKYKQPSTSVIDTKKKRIVEGMTVNQIDGMIRYHDYNNTKIALELDIHRQIVWDVINRIRKKSRLAIRVRNKIVQIIKKEDESLKEAHTRIWGEPPPFWFSEFV
jgi:predicted DNA-binding protein (UPF0251 family)